MARTTKPKPAQDTISIKDAIARLATNEQNLRLALIEIRPDDFDTIRALPLADFEYVAKKLNQQQLPAPPQNSDIPTPQDLQPATDEPQNAPIVPQAPQPQLNTNPQSPIPNTGLSLVEQMAKQAQEEIAAVDAIAQVKNALILNNLAVRDAELQEAVNQRWQGQKQGYLGVIRDLAGLAKEPVEITPDSTDITQEIGSIMAQLGKQLHV